MNMRGSRDQHTEDMMNYESEMYAEMTHSKDEAKRDPIGLRYDLLDPVFLNILGEIASYGAKKYGDRNWQKSRLEGDKSCVNHIFKHLIQYMQKEEYDHKEIGSEHWIHLCAIAFNCMMLLYHDIREDDDKK